MNMNEWINEDATQYDKILAERDQYKTERDTLIEDLSWYKAKVSRLERENKDLKNENKASRLQSDIYFGEWQNIKNLYDILTQHIRDKAELNPSVDRYIALVNFVDRLEGE